MKVIWSKKADDELQRIEKYISIKFGNSSLRSYIQEVDKTSDILAETPEYGKIDSLFSKHSKTYRSVIIHKLSKLVYYIDGETIHIAAIWDTRREPKSQASKL